MNDHDLDIAVTRVNPTHRSGCLLERRQLDALFEEIVASPQLRSATGGVVRTGRATRPRWSGAVVAAVSAAVVALGLGGFLLARHAGETPAVGTAGVATTTVAPTTTPPPSVLDDFPLTVLPDDAWVMTYLDQQPPPGNPAEMWFLIAADAASGTTVLHQETNADGDVTVEWTDPGKELALAWYPYDRTMDWGTDEPELEAITVLGHEARVKAGDGAFVVVVPLTHGSLEIRAEVANSDELAQLIAGLRVVDTPTFERAFPESVVTPAQRGAVMTQMSAGIPPLPSVDLRDVRVAFGYSDRYQLGAAVVRAYACGWFDVWFTAIESGDADTATTARSALASSHHWPVLIEMAESGAYPDVLWEYADALNGGEIDGGLTWETLEGGLGCEPDPQTSVEPTTQAAGG